MQPDDVIVSFNGTPVEDPGHLSRLVSDARIGSTAALGVIRDGRRVELKVRHRAACRPASTALDACRTGPS